MTIKRYQRNLLSKKTKKASSLGNQADTSRSQWSAKSIALDTKLEESQVALTQQNSASTAFQSTTDPNFENDEKQEQIQYIPEEKNEEAIRGDDLRVDLQLDAQEALLGGEKEIRVSHLEICWNCVGTGYLQSNSMILNLYPECPICDTRGSRRETKRLRITVPPGVNSETRLRVRGEGDVGRHGGESGDLYIYLSVDNDAKI